MDTFHVPGVKFSSLDTKISTQYFIEIHSFASLNAFSVTPEDAQPTFRVLGKFCLTDRCIWHFWRQIILSLQFYHLNHHKTIRAAYFLSRLNGIILIFCHIKACASLTQQSSYAWIKSSPTVYIAITKITYFIHWDNEAVQDAWRKTQSNQEWYSKDKAVENHFMLGGFSMINVFHKGL